MQICVTHSLALELRQFWSNSHSSKTLVPKTFFVVSGTLALVLNMRSSQGSRLRYTFEKHLFNQKHVCWEVFQKFTIIFPEHRSQIFYYEFKGKIWNKRMQKFHFIWVKE